MDLYSIELRFSLLFGERFIHRCNNWIVQFCDDSSKHGNLLMTRITRYVNI